MSLDNYIIFIFVLGCFSEKIGKGQNYVRLVKKNKTPNWFCNVFVHGLSKNELGRGHEIKKMLKIMYALK